MYNTLLAKYILLFANLLLLLLLNLGSLHGRVGRPLEFVVFENALKDLAIALGINSLAVLLVIHPLSLVATAVGIEKHAFTRFPTIPPLALVSVAHLSLCRTKGGAIVKPNELPCSVIKASLPFPFIDLSLIVPFHLASAMSHIISPVTLVDVATSVHHVALSVTAVFLPRAPVKLGLVRVVVKRSLSVALAVLPLAVVDGGHCTTPKLPIAVLETIENTTRIRAAVGPSITPSADGLKGRERNFQ